MSSAVEYKVVDTNTISGIEQAERLLAAGWKVYRSGLFHVVLRIIRKA